MIWSYEHECQGWKEMCLQNTSDGHKKWPECKKQILYLHTTTSDS